MWVSKKKWQALEKRIADLEALVQSQLIIDQQKLAGSIKEVICRCSTTHDNVPKPSS